MSSLDDASVGTVSSDVTIEQLTEEKLALQAQNAQLWRLVDKQRNMIHSLQKDLEKATAVVRQDRARHSIGADGSLPYPTTPKKGDHAERMPNAPDVIEDYDDASSTAEQSPETFSAVPSSAKARAKRSSPRALDFHANRIADGEQPPVKSPLRSGTIVRQVAVDERQQQQQPQPALPDGTSTPMSPALSMRLQQVNRVVSPLTQSFQNVAQASLHERSGMEEVERVNIPRRERVRSPNSRASSFNRLTPSEDAKSSTARPESRQNHADIGPRPKAIDDRTRPVLASANPDVSTAISENGLRSSTPDGPRSESRAESVLAAQSLSRTMSNSESGGTLADIADPYYSQSSLFLPLNSDTESQVAHTKAPLRPSKLAQKPSPESDYGTFPEPNGPPKTPEHTRAPTLILEPPVEFLPTPVKYTWNEHSPERLRSGSITSMVSESSIRPSESTPSVGTSTSSVVPLKEVLNIKVVMVEQKPSTYVDLTISKHDMSVLHQLRKTYTDLDGLQKAIPLQSGLQLPSREDFDNTASASQTTLCTAVDAWFAALQEQLQHSKDSRAAALFSNFLSSDILIHTPDESTSSQSLNEQVESRSTASLQPREVFPARMTKEGFLKKRGKNFGGWRSRFFVLDGPILRYYESPNGSQLGTIKLPMAQIGRQSPTNGSDSAQNDKEAERLQHAFLILEPKKRNTNSFVRHVLCASSDAERDDWIAALMTHVHPEDAFANSADDYRNNVSRIDAGDNKRTTKNTILTTPTRGTPYEANEPSPRSFPKDNLKAIGYGETKPGRQPLFDADNAVPPSPASRATLDSDFSSMSISRPLNGAPIENNTAWGATSLSSPSMNMPTPPAIPNVPADKKVKKKSFWNFGKGSDHNTAPRDLSAAQSPSYSDLTFAQTGLPSQSSGIFGLPLSDAVQIALDRGFNTGVPIVVSRCIDYLDLKHAEQEEGIYRLSGSSNVIRGLKERFNQEIDINLAGAGEYFDIHAIAGLLKLYLRELPSSILTQDLQRDFLDILEIPEGLARTVTVRTLVHSLPKDNFELLKILSRHLSTVVSNADTNKMSLRNVGIVFSPTLNIPAAVFQLFIAEYDALFEDREVDRSRNLAPPVSNDASSIRSARSNNPTASVILDAEQSYNLLQQDYSNKSQTKSGNNPYGVYEYGAAHNAGTNGQQRFVKEYV